jgi:hypothetical protein
MQPIPKINPSIFLLEFHSVMGGSVGEFNVINLTADIVSNLEYYILCRETAIQENNLVHIADSISHAWQYKGGVLDLVAEAKTRTKGGNDKYGRKGRSRSYG